MFYIDFVNFYKRDRLVKKKIPITNKDKNGTLNGSKLNAKSSPNKKLRMNK